jgi:hypothetical protein
MDQGTVTASFSTWSIMLVRVILQLLTADRTNLRFSFEVTVKIEIIAA